MQCLYSVVDAGSVLSLSCMFLDIKNHCQNISLLSFCCVWLNMMGLYIYHGNKGMEMMIQEVYSTYMVGGIFCYGMC